MSVYGGAAGSSGKHRRRASMLQEGDGMVHSYPVDLSACEWVQGSDGLQHLRLPLWMHPQSEGTPPVVPVQIEKLRIFRTIVWVTLGEN